MRAFELAELMAEGGLREVEPPGRAGLSAGFGDRGDESEVSEVEVQRPRELVVRHA